MCVCVYVCAWRECNEQTLVKVHDTVTRKTDEEGITAISRGTSMYMTLRVAWRGFWAFARPPLFRLRVFRCYAPSGKISAKFRQLRALSFFWCIKLSCSSSRSKVMAESSPDVAVSPAQGRVSPEQGQRGFHILREISLVCNGRAPTSGADDRRFVVPGGKGLPDVRLWPGVKIVRKVSVGQHVLEVVCSVQESADGPLFTCCVTDADDHFPFSSLQTVASSMTSAVRKLFQQLRVELGADEESSLEKNVKGPYFFGLRSAEFGIAHTLDATLFPGKQLGRTSMNQSATVEWTTTRM